MSKNIKQCNRCHKEKPVEDFYKWKYGPDGLNRTCKSCLSQRKYKDNITTPLYNSKQRAKEKGWKFNLDRDYLKKQWDKQEGKCYYSGLAMTRKNRWLTPSIDRKNNELGYLKNNVVWCCWGVNTFKSDLSESTFYDLLENITWRQLHKRVFFEKIRPTAKEPYRASKDATCFDLYSVESGEVRFGEISIFSLGIKIKLPKGYEAQVRARSGLAYKHGIMLVNGIGSIDNDFRGEMLVMLTTCLNKYKDKGFQIKAGDRIAQLTIQKVPKYSFVEGKVENDTQRGEGGFGSTGN